MKKWLLLVVAVTGAVGIGLLEFASQRASEHGASSDGGSAAPPAQPVVSVERADPMALRAPLEPAVSAPIASSEPEPPASIDAPVVSAPAPPVLPERPPRVRNDPEIFARKYRGVGLEGLAVAKVRVHRELIDAQTAAFDATYAAGDFTTEILQPEEIPDIDTAMKNAKGHSDNLMHSSRATRDAKGRLERRLTTLDPVKYSGVYLLSDELGWIDVAMTKLK